MPKQETNHASQDSMVEELFRNPRTTEMPVSGERRAERLRPGQFNRLKNEQPILFVPLGTVEWHERHQPLGLDGLKAHGICCRVADRTGGIVFPALFWGVDTYRTSSNGRILRGMDSECGFRLPGSVYQIAENTFECLLRDMLKEAFSAGFEVVVLFTGHNSPVQESLIRKVALDANERAGRTVVLPTNDWENARHEFAWAGDHAAKWETSLMMALEPELVDLSILPNRPTGLTAIGGIDPRDEASRDLGEQALEVIVSTLTDKIGSIRGTC